MQARSSSESPRSLSVGTTEHFGWLQGIVKAVLVLNLLDALFTLVWVRSGLAREANPLIDQLVNEHAVGFVFVKLGLVGLGSWLLWHRRERPAAVIAIVAAFLAYYLILLYHIQYASGLVRQLLGNG
jgi:uncharacterized membrane protein